jgi:hypothetical protein
MALYNQGERTNGPFRLSRFPTHAARSSASLPRRDFSRARLSGKATTTNPRPLHRSPAQEKPDVVDGLSHADPPVTLV